MTADVGGELKVRQVLDIDNYDVDNFGADIQRTLD